MNENKTIISLAFENRELLNDISTQNAVFETIEQLDKGIIRVAEFKDQTWVINDWIKKAILLYFGLRKMETFELNPFEYYDKIPLKKDFKTKQARLVPGAIARYGSYLAPNTILMPSFVNIGAYVDSGTLVDTWATVGSCAQIGKNVHLSGGVGIGGVLEPIQATPVIIEDNVFVGSRSIIVEGVVIGKEAVLGSNVVITNSTKIIDVSNNEALEYKAYIPPRSVVIPGSISKQFPAGTYNVNCALIIGKRKESTDLKTSLNDALREFKLDI